jgi:hypothetical protein
MGRFLVMWEPILTLVDYIVAASVLRFGVELSLIIIRT